MHVCLQAEVLKRLTEMEMSDGTMNRDLLELKEQQRITSQMQAKIRTVLMAQVNQNSLAVSCRL